MKKIQLSIPEPCHEHWDHMTPTQQGRFCNACAKEVIDFSNMNDSEVLHYFTRKKKTDTVCGRAYPDQLNRDIMALPEKKKYWQWQYILSALLFFMKPAKTKAQGMIGYLPSKDTVTEMESKKKMPEQIYIRGLVKDEEGNPVPFAGVKCLGLVKGVVADSQGIFKIAVDKPDAILEISCSGYKTKQSGISNVGQTEVILHRDIKLMKEVVVEPQTVQGGIRRCTIVAGGMFVKVSRRKLLTDSIRNWIKDPVTAIKIYPNPVPKGSTFNISIIAKEGSTYTIQIIDAAGRLLEERKINAVAKIVSEQFTTAATWGSGIYFVKLMDAKGKPSKAVSMMVQ